MPESLTVPLNEADELLKMNLKEKKKRKSKR